MKDLKNHADNYQINFNIIETEFANGRNAKRIADIETTNSC
jgi:hypothetical protein